MLAYALRRIDAHDAKDVVADTFLVAWRRAEQIPEDPLPWLLGVARKVISTKRRGAQRRNDLELKLERQTTGHPEDVHIDRLDVAQAFMSLSDKDREVLMLVARVDDRKYLERAVSTLLD